MFLNEWFSPGPSAGGATPPQAAECRKKDSEAAGSHKVANPNAKRIPPIQGRGQPLAGSGAGPSGARGRASFGASATTPALHKKRVGKRRSFSTLFYVDKSYAAPERCSPALAGNSEDAKRMSVFPSPDEPKWGGILPRSKYRAESQQRLTPRFGGFPVAPEPLRMHTFTPSEMLSSLRSTKLLHNYTLLPFSQQILQSSCIFRKGVI